MILIPETSQSLLSFRFCLESSCSSSVVLSAIGHTPCYLPDKEITGDKITIGLPNAVSYMYAMRKGGAEIITILRSLSEMSAIYGEVSLEFRQAVRDADFFGYDIINALKHVSETTRAENSGDFCRILSLRLRVEEILLSSFRTGFYSSGRSEV